MTTLAVPIVHGPMIGMTHYGIAFFLPRLEMIFFDEIMQGHPGSNNPTKWSPAAGRRGEDALP